MFTRFRRKRLNATLRELLTETTIRWQMILYIHNLLEVERGLQKEG